MVLAPISLLAIPLDNMLKLATLALCFASLLDGALAQDFKLYGYATLGGGMTPILARRNAR